MPFVPISQVTLTGGPLFQAQEADRAYLRALEPDRLLAPFLREAGLEPRAASYDDWEVRGLDGHTAGHYLSACSLMVASTGDDVLRSRLEYAVAELARAQDHLGTGYVGGVPRSAELWAEVAAGITESTFRAGRWVPWYNLHKLYAGLIDAARLTGNQVARDVVLRLATWWEELAAGIDDEHFQLMLETEIGGMNEAYVDLFDLTGDPRHLAMAARFTSTALSGPLSRRSDELTGLHANTRIPQFVGFAALAARSADPALARAARFAWETILTRRTVAIGGNSVREHFHAIDDFTPMTEDREGPETCNSYNLIKLGRRLSADGSDPAITDALERILFNHLLSSQHPEHGGLVYFTSMRPDHYRVYSSPEHSFWCCVGTGLESHAKHGESLYRFDDDAVSVELFAPSVVRIPELGLELEQRTAFPSDGVVGLTLGLTGPRRFRLRVRVPGWSDPTPEVFLNGAPVTAGLERGHFVVDREWSDGDTVSFELRMSGRAEPYPDGSDWTSLLWGPSVLAARGESLPTDVVLAGRAHAPHTAVGPLTPLASAPIVPRSAVPYRDADGRLRIDSDRGPIPLEPFAGLHDARYTVTFPVASTADEDAVARRRTALVERDRRAASIDGRTVDRVALGEQQPEADHAFEGVASASGAVGGVRWRSTAKRLSVTLVDPHLLGRVVRVTWLHDPAGHGLTLEIDGTPVAPQEGGRDDDLEWAEYPLTPTSAGWGVRRFALVAEPDRETPRCTELRVLTAEGV
ncbi:beta-L-arabinofuranosidase domain-containing protein [Plantibacter sp. MPB07]|uniref:beta-L-arabinofuranosidase domain-containing protein n=1 Tax=Plantibacter sp. MPB07 TaxID=3388853 RepID=UPI00398804CE